jgi:hypothetical protein
MEITTERAIAKIIFWQEVVAMIFTLCLLIVWGLLLYGMYKRWEFGYYRDFLIQTTFQIALGSLATYAVFFLYKSSSLFKSYQRSQEQLDLELAFKKQRHFWMMGPILLILSILTSIFSSIFL